MLVLQKQKYQLSLSLISFKDKENLKIHDALHRLTFRVSNRLIIQCVKVNYIMDLKITKKHFSAGRPYHNDFKSCKNEKNNVLISLVEYIVKTFYKICISDLPKCADAYYSLYIQKQPPEVFYKKRCF